MKEKANQNELVIVILNEGFSEVAMNAARDSGARGGTIMHGRGTGTKEMEKKYNIHITPQKEIIYIIVKEDIKDKVMSAVNAAVGIETNAQGIVFSIPVDNVSGLKFE